MILNVEYNQLGGLLKNKGEPVDTFGYSKYPGNINSLVISIPEYVVQLEKNKGCISEFINPKYGDKTKTFFSSPARLECMMQDYPKCLADCKRVSITQVDRRFCFSTVKNDIKSAADKAKQNLPAEGASTCEYDVY